MYCRLVSTHYIYISTYILIAFKSVLHPYYKLHYIKQKWGGAKEQEAERAAGDEFAKNWQDEARKIIEKTVRKYI